MSEDNGLPMEERPRYHNLKRMANEHWKEHRPKMYRELKKSGQLEEALSEAARFTVEAEDRIFEQLKKQHSYPKTENNLEIAAHYNWLRNTAWELVREQYILLPSERDRRSL